MDEHRKKHIHTIALVAFTSTNGQAEFVELIASLLQQGEWENFDAESVVKAAMTRLDNHSPKEQSP